jgi:hypothetical protein
VTEPLTEQELRTFVGPRADYYLSKWAGDRRGMGFNWAAFLLSGLWLPYRKMYLATFILYAIILVESVLEDVVFVGILGQADTPAALPRIVALAVAITCGTLGNRWYYAHACSKIRGLREQGMPDETYLDSLGERGGTSVPAALGMFFLFLILMIAAVLTMEFALGT